MNEGRTIRILAFVLHDREFNVQKLAANNHLKKIANQYNLAYKEADFENFRIGFVHRGEIGREPITGLDRFVVCSHTLKNFVQDRYLVIEFEKNRVKFSSDYAGSIPVFYSFRSGFTASNLEKCVLRASRFSESDIDYESVYGLMRFGHFIWDETAWKHIKQLLPNRHSFIDLRNSTVEFKRNDSVFVAEVRNHRSIESIANELCDLNSNLVIDSLKNCDSVVLPLSSGYDSRMIFCALAQERDLRAKLTCFTYGNRGAIEVSAARELCKIAEVQWSHLELPAQFLRKEYLTRSADIFGSSMHMHGMYQFEAIETLRSKNLVLNNSTFTSGFMTGVPAGQHNRLLDLEGNNTGLCNAMNNFSLSKVWKANELEAMPIFQGKGFEESCESRFANAFNDFDGESHQKSILFDIWTRQRNYISYHPRVLEWFNPVASPHMNPDYINFFLSLSPDHLTDRSAVQAMFKHRYGRYAKVPSDSNLLRGIGPKFKTLLYFMPQILGKLGIMTESFFGFESGDSKFDQRAIVDADKESFFPLLDVSQNNEVAEFCKNFGGNDFFESAFQDAKIGTIKSYLRIVGLQAVALSLYDQP